MIDANEIILPIVHLNGTAKQDLIDQRCALHAALNDVLDALRTCGPNGRDYYPEPGRMERAEKQHRRRGEAIKALVDELEFEINAIDEM